MHFCGNVWHDLGFYVALTLPFLSTTMWWLRSKYYSLIGKKNYKKDCKH